MTDPHIIAHDLLASDGRTVGCKICRRFAWIGLWLLHSHGKEYVHFERECLKDYMRRYGEVAEVLGQATKVIQLVWQWWVLIDDYDAAKQTAAELRAAIREADWPD